MMVTLGNPRPWSGSKDAFTRWAEQELKLVTAAMDKQMHEILYGEAEPFSNPVMESVMTADRMELLFLKVQTGKMEIRTAMAEVSQALNLAWASGADFGVEAVIEG